MTIMIFHSHALEQVLNSDGVQRHLESEARAVVGRARGKPGTSEMEFRTRSGKSRRGAYAQAIMRGRAAILVEFGGAGRPAHAPLRSSIH